MGVARHLHFDDEQMRKTLPKAVAFELDSDYQKFIREFILESSPPDVTNTRRSLDALRKAEMRVSQLHDQQLLLERITEEDRLYQNAFREEALFGHLRHALDHAEAEEKCKKLEATLAALCSRHVENEHRMGQAVAAKITAQQELDAVKLIAGKEDPKLSDFERLTREEQEFAEEVVRLTAKARTAREFLVGRARAWEHWMGHATSLGLQIKVDGGKLAALRDTDTRRALDGVARLVGEFHRVWNDTKESLRQKVKDIEELERKHERLERQFEQLQAGRTAPTPLLDMLHGMGITAHTLARMVEVSSDGELWWGIIEALLGDDRNAVIVESNVDFLRAREAWIKMQKAEPLIHPEEIPTQVPVVNALASFLATTHPVARQFLDWRLGRITAVREGSDLEVCQHDAATPEGAVKESPVLRHVTPEREFTLGEEGLRRLRTAKGTELADVSAQLAARRRERDDVNHWLQRGKDTRLDQDDSPTGSSELHRLSVVQTDLERTRNTIKLIETPDLKKRLAQLNRLETTLAAANQTIGELKGPLTEFKTKQSRLEEELETARLEWKDAGITLHGDRVKLPPGVLDAEITERLHAAIGTIPSWKQRRDQAEVARESWQRRANEAKNRRLQQRDILLSTHQDEFGEFDPQDDDNIRFDKRLEQIREHEVKRFETIATERRTDWEKRLQEDVLDRLSERLKDARQTVEDFRRILSREIGAYRYLLSQTRDPLHRAMWKLLDQSGDGLQPGDALLDWKLQAEIEDAKSELMRAIDQPEDKRAAALLDYRNYHRYDLEMVPLGHSDESEGRISLQQSGRSLSGGEGQAPFFVAMLAAFHRVYDRGQRGRQSNLGLVVMDEAFSKLSAGHIADCLALAGGFGLQLILAFPMDRLGTMVQHADSIIQCRVERRSDVKGIPVGIINDVIYWGRDHALTEFVL
ncbi:MAG: SbcC/MukB-like Walker B domain-containing protein [Luteolibacter sp.]